ncbi:MAG: 16S rRNA (guanine(527)-N(7))-methyltransferase RsmG [Succinivibrio sp.]
MRKESSEINKSELVDKIRSLLNKTDVIFNEDQIDKLAQLVQLLLKWNKSLNLTAIRDYNQMIVLHIIDSAVISPLIQNKGKNIADVGTGAGFPGLVLAILNPDVHFTLIDSIAKKLSFVRTAMVTLDLKNVTIINDRCENIKLENKFDCILSRAFAPLCKIVEWCKDLLSEEGCFIAMKANLDEKEKTEIPNISKIEQIIDLEVPSLDAKRIAVIMKLNKEGI